MTRFLVAALVSVSVAGGSGAARGDEAEAKAVIDKAIKAAGGEEKLGKGRAFTWANKGTITLNGDDNSISGRTTAQGLDRYRAEFEGDFNGNSVKGVVVLDGDKGWRKFNDDASELDADAVAREKRNVYLQLVPAFLVPLKGKGFKVNPAPEAKIGGNPAAAVKVTGPDGKDFTLYFDKESGLPVKMTARVAGFNGEEFDQVTTYTAYKDFGGIKKATKVESTRDGSKFISSEITEFKAVDKVDPDTFTEPK